MDSGGLKENNSLGGFNGIKPQLCQEKPSIYPAFPCNSCTRLSPPLSSHPTPHPPLMPGEQTGDNLTLDICSGAGKRAWESDYSIFPPWAEAGALKKREREGPEVMHLGLCPDRWPFHAWPPCLLLSHSTYTGTHWSPHSTVPSSYVRHRAKALPVTVLVLWEITFYKSWCCLVVVSIQTFQELSRGA